jgi:hypothetical protein
MASVSKSSRPRTGSMTTRNGKVRLKPLNLTQLSDLLEKTAKKTSKSKIRNRIRDLEARA